MSDSILLNETVGISLPAQRFRVTVAVSERTTLALAEEFLLRFVFLMGGVRFSEIMMFFGFDRREVEALVSWMVRDGYLAIVDDTIRLGGRGMAAMNEVREHGPTDPIIVRPVEVVESLTLERVAYSPITFVRRPTRAALEMQKGEARFDVPQEVARAADHHFAEWVRSWSDIRTRQTAEALFGVLDVRSEAHLATYEEANVLLHVAPESYRVELDIPQFRNLPDTKSRRNLSAGIKGFVEKAAAAPTTRTALPALERLDEGLLSQYYRIKRFDFTRFIVDRGRDPKGTISFVGSSASDVARKIMFEMINDARKPLLWLRPADGFWGTSVAYTELFEKLSTLYGSVGGMRLIYGGARTPHLARSLRKRFIERDGPFTSLGCLPTIDGNIGLEILCEPGHWVMLLLRGLDDAQENEIPVSVGFYSVDRRICDRIERLLSQFEDDRSNDTL